MTSSRVQTTCDRCGEIEIDGADITIVPLIATLENAYRFRCPTCAAWTVKVVSPDVIELLLLAGAVVATWEVELIAAHESPLGPITDADLVAFHKQLERLPTTEE